MFQHPTDIAGDKSKTAAGIKVKFYVASDTTSKREVKNK